LSKVNLIEKKVMMSTWDAVKFQVLTHCYLRKIQMSEADLDCLSHLALNPDKDLTSFCEYVSELKVFSTAQSVRNAIRKAELKGLITKEGKNKKKLILTFPVHIKGNLLLNYNFLALETN
jgi:hypothetical protein